GRRRGDHFARRGRRWRVLGRIGGAERSFVAVPQPAPPTGAALAALHVHGPAAAAVGAEALGGDLVHHHLVATEVVAGDIHDLVFRRARAGRKRQNQEGDAPHPRRHGHRTSMTRNLFNWGV